MCFLLLVEWWFGGWATHLHPPVRRRWDVHGEHGHVVRGVAMLRVERPLALDGGQHVVQVGDFREHPLSKVNTHLSKQCEK
jgi:hypothetical protein